MKSALASACLGLVLMATHAGAAAAAGAHGVAAAATAAPQITMHQFTQMPVAPREVRWSRRPLSDEALKEIARLRDEGMALQKADGGKLTPRHRDYLQSKLDAIWQSGR